MPSAPIEWFRSTFLKRRWTVLTAAPLLVSGINWAILHLSPLPPDVHAASIWQAPAWLWIVCFMGCLSVAQIFGWAEQHRMVKELSGRPDLTVRVNFLNGHHGEVMFLLQNANSHVAIDISALPIEVPMREGQSRTIRFTPVSRLAGQLGDFERLHYVISGVGIGPLSRKDDLRELFENCSALSDNGDAVLPMCLTFSNMGDPKRRWHSHYAIRYLRSPGSDTIHMEHIGISELKTPLNEVCSRCNSGKMIKR